MAKAGYQRLGLGPNDVSPTGPLSDSHTVADAFNLTLSGGAVSNGTGTEATNAVTINGVKGTITTSALTTAHNAAYVITLTNSSITAASRFKARLYAYSGTLITNGVPYLVWAAPGTGSVVLTILNIDPTNSLNGLCKIDFEVNL